MKRRAFISLLGGASAWPIAARAQQAAMPVIAWLSAASPDGYRPMVTAFRQGLQESGYVEGQNVVIEYRWAEGRSDRLPGMAADLIHRQVTVIAATGTPAALAAQAATTTIPIVFETGSNPIQLGLVASLSRPGGNLTGVNSLIADAWPKQFDLLTKLLPTSRVFAILFTGGAADQLERLRQEVQPAAEAIGRKLTLVTARVPQELDDLFSEFARQRADALIVRASPIAYAMREE